MGVQGLTKLLREQGCFPSNSSSCTQSLWRDSSNFLEDASLHEVVRIPPHSTLALDGNGLAYYLHNVAYSRYFAQVTGGSAVQTTNGGCCCSTRGLSETQVTRLLPQYMPLDILEDVTKEFVQSLQNQHMKLDVYWDGEGRRFKAATTAHRRETRDTEWSRLKQYSLYGIFPPSKNKKLCRRDWLYNLPMSRLLLHQVRHVLLQYPSVSMIQCAEEADSEVAKASASDPNCYCVGLDSDYCLFSDIRYVPLNTLDASGSVVTAVVLTRASIAEHLDLPTEESMVEFAILLGNDYVENTKESQLDFCASNLDDVLDHVRQQDADYRVTSKVLEVQRAIDFTRALYEFQDLSDFPLDDEEDEPSFEVLEDESESTTRVKLTAADFNRPALPAGLNMSLADPKPFDFSVSGVVSRTVQALLDDFEEDEYSLVRQKHLDAFLKIAVRLQESPIIRLEDDEIVRPQWEDIMAAYILERLIGTVLRLNPSSPLARISNPAKLFDHALFHSLMAADRTNSADAKVSTPPAITKKVEEPEEAGRAVLPIDEHEAEILDAVENQRVTIIHGETGCGKSSRVPVMLLRAPPPDPSMQGVKMFISQPRRIAAKSLVERVRSCEPDLRNDIALRMGHGVREYETSKTRAWFVTTGYLVRLLANHPERFDDCSHLIIDEVHERSVDTDILCLLCRRLLAKNHRIRLILMSATMAATLYQQYFGVPEEPIHVGARRFPIKEYYVEDLSKRFTFPSADMKAAKAIINDCERTNCMSPPSNSYMDNLFRLAVRLVVCVGRSGSSILVFVPGMNEIIAITDLIEKQYIPGIRFTCYPIHSDVPFEEQMSAFESPADDEIKVIIATNAAESSVTLPDVDDVICLGLCKQIEYNAASHRQMLMPAWISRASATQRAGRTGRVRNGNVYRLYTKRVFEESMDAFETGEMLRIPLDSVILTLKEMLGEKVTPVLLDCLEPPDVSNISRSFKSLGLAGYLTLPNDDGNITTLGKFVSLLGIDLALGSFVGLGIQFGVGAEAIEMAAILSFPKTPWMMTSPLFHDPPEFNDITARTFMSRCHFDANLYSEPLAIMNLIWDFERAKNQNGFAWHYSLSAQRVRRLVATRNSLRSRVAEFVGVDVDRISVKKPPAQMEHAKITLLRVIQVWVFSESMIESIQAAATVGDGAVMLSMTGDRVSASHLEQVLDPERHSFDFISNREIVQNGSFSPVVEEEFSVESFLIDFESRFVSFALEKSIDVCWYSTDESFHLFVREDLIESDGLDALRKRLAEIAQADLFAAPSKQRRGMKERPCGLWDVTLRSENDRKDPDLVTIRKLSCSKKNISKSITRYLNRHVLDLEGVECSVSCSFSKYKKKKGRRMPSFSLVSRGKCSEVSKVDLCDLFGTPNVNSNTRESDSVQQKIVFSSNANAPILPDKQLGVKSATGSHGPASSWHRPLLNDIPEGARLLSVLASGRRKEHSIRLLSDEDVDDTGASSKKTKNQDDAYLEVKMNRDETKISQRWRQFSSDRSVYVAENSVPAAAMSLQGPVEVFACCANTLEVRGGGLRVEGLTLLPPGRLFTLLAFLTFGLQPFTANNDASDDSDDENGESSILSQSLRWLNTWEELIAGVSESKVDSRPAVDPTERILAANSFHRSSMELQESLVCYPAMVREICEVFDGVDGNAVTPWKDLDEDPFVEKYLRQVQSERRERVSQSDVSVRSESQPTKKPSRRRKKKSGGGGGSAEKKASPKVPRARSNKNDVQLAKGSLRDTTIVDEFSMDVMAVAPKLFATTLKPGESIGELDLPSSNILSIVIKHYCDFLLDNNLDPDADWIELEAEVSLSDRHWLVRSMKDNGGKEWFMAEFVGTVMPNRAIKERGHGLPGWLSQGRARPSTSQRAMECVPPNISSIPRYTAKIYFSECETGKAVFFDSVERALQMEAAFWLERQFGEPSRRWFQQSLDEMMKKATTLEAFIPRED